MKSKLQATTLLLAGILLLAVFAPAESAELKEKFLQRKPLLEKMKDQGVISENNLGFLTFRSVEGQDEKNIQIVQVENADRKTVYAEIAAKVGASVEEVGKRRAVQIATLAAAGHWLQDADGKWYQKK